MFDRFFFTQTCILIQTLLKGIHAFLIFYIATCNILTVEKNLNWRKTDGKIISQKCHQIFQCCIKHTCLSWVRPFPIFEVSILRSVLNLDLSALSFKSWLAMTIQSDVNKTVNIQPKYACQISSVFSYFLSVLVFILS